MPDQVDVETNLLLSRLGIACRRTDCEDVPDGYDAGDVRAAIRQLVETRTAAQAAASRLHRRLTEGGPVDVDWLVAVVLTCRRAHGGFQDGAHVGFCPTCRRDVVNRLTDPPR